jgi:hypothetical protein
VIFTTFEMIAAVEYGGRVEIYTIHRVNTCMARSYGRGRERLCYTSGAISA